MHWRARFAGLAVAAAGFGLAVLAADRIAPPDFARAHERSTVVLAAGGEVLRGYLTPDDKWRLPVTAREVDPRYLKLLIAYEDQRFADHGGVDVSALARAGLQALGHFGVVSGASTLTMQTARLLEPIRRDLPGKLWQMARALQIEARLSKDEILDTYLTLAPFGGNIEGVRAAALAYFGKEPKRLTLAEAALLVALPQSPERNRPDRFPARAKAARDKVLRILMERGVVAPEEAVEAMGDPVPEARLPMPFLAPHFADAVRRARPEAREIRTTIDLRLQKAAEAAIVDAAAAQPDGGTFAAVIVDNSTQAIIAAVSGHDFWGPQGQVDLTLSVRSPGSALKPFIYGIGFDDHLLHPASLIDDKPVSFGTYAPRNFDRGFQGTVTVRDALHMSLNVPAVAVLERIGPVRLSAMMTQSGAKLVWPSRFAGPSLPMALGGVGLSLHDLTMLYTGIANDGLARPLRRFSDEPMGALNRMFGPAAAYYLWDVLRGAPLPDGWAMGRGIQRREVAFKTGTSFGFRDAWAVGFSGRTTIGVWAGRADGSTRPGAMGRNAAAPVMLRLFDQLSPEPSGSHLPPPDALIVMNAEALPPALQRFSPRLTHPGLARQIPPPAIAFPPDGSIVEYDPESPQLTLRAEGGAAPLRWVVDGTPLPESAAYQPVIWTPESEGFSRLTVIDAQGRSATATIRLKRGG